MLPPLILLHGFTQTRQSWRRTAMALGSRYRAITPDLPGHGQAALRTPSFDAVTAYLRALAPSEPFTLAGYSMGGRIALHAAFTLPLDRLILIGASPGLQDPKEREQRKQADEQLANKIEAIGVEAVRARVGEPPAVHRPARQRQSRGLRRPPAQHAARPRGSAARLRDRADGAAVGSPAGADDPGDADHRRTRREVPRARRADGEAATERAARDDPEHGPRAATRGPASASRKPFTNRGRPLRRPPRSRRRRNPLPATRRTRRCRA